MTGPAATSGRHAGSKTENLDRAWQALADARICMLVTRDGEELHARPMSAQADQDGNAVWFITALSGHKDEEIAEDNRVCIVVEDAKAGEFLSLSGRAKVVTDRKTISAHWTKDADAWFAGGEKDPDACLLKVTPVGAKFWKTPNLDIARTPH